MAYQNVPVADGYQVVQQIANFAAVNGWTVHRDEQRPDAPDWWIITLSVGTGAYLTLIGGQSNIFLNGHRGLDLNADWDAQPDQFRDTTTTTTNYYTTTRVDLRVNPILSISLFGGSSPSPYIYVAIEKEPGYYRHICFGYVEKFGTASGGLFWDIAETTTGAYRSYRYNNYYPCLYNAKVSYHYNRNGGLDTQNALGEAAWGAFGDGSPYITAGHWISEIYTIQVASPIQFNGRTPLQPLMVQVSTEGYRPFGMIPNMRFIDMTFYEAGDEITIGTDVWKVFPYIRKAPGSSTVYDDSTSGEGSHVYGVAYLKD